VEDHWHKFIPNLFKIFDIVNESELSNFGGNKGCTTKFPFLKN